MVDFGLLRPELELARAAARLGRADLIANRRRFVWFATPREAGSRAVRHRYRSAPIQHRRQQPPAVILDSRAPSKPVLRGVLAALVLSAGMQSAGALAHYETGCSGSGRWMPHSVLPRPGHRHARGLSPWPVRAVQGRHPIDG